MASELPEPSRRARDLVRKRARTPLPETGRRHHIGAVPAQMPILGESGPGGFTRTTRVQLEALHNNELGPLLARIELEMAQAAASEEFELAAHLRDQRSALLEEMANRRRDVSSE